MEGYFVVSDAFLSWSYPSLLVGINWVVAWLVCSQVTHKKKNLVLIVVVGDKPPSKSFHWMSREGYFKISDAFLSWSYPSLLVGINVVVA